MTSVAINQVGRNDQIYRLQYVLKDGRAFVFRSHLLSRLDMMNSCFSSQILVTCLHVLHCCCPSFLSIRRGVPRCVVMPAAEKGNRNKVED